MGVQAFLFIIDLKGFQSHVSVLVNLLGHTLNVVWFVMRVICGFIIERLTPETFRIHWNCFDFLFENVPDFIGVKYGSLDISYMCSERCKGTHGLQHGAAVPSLAAWAIVWPIWVMHLMPQGPFWLGSLVPVGAKGPAQIFLEGRRGLDGQRQLVGRWRPRAAPSP
jgi:hypothetical protein